MAKTVIVGIFCFIIGYVVGNSSSTNIEIDKTKMSPVVDNSKSKETSADELESNLIPKIEKKEATNNESKKPTRHQYFKKKNNAIGKAETLLNKAARMDRRVVDGEPKMYLLVGLTIEYSLERGPMKL
jgi:hypothetical protein